MATRKSPPPLTLSGQKVQAARIRAGLTVTDLATKSNVHFSTIYRIESEDSAVYQPQLRIVKRLAAALKAKVADWYEENPRVAA